MGLAVFPIAHCGAAFWHRGLMLAVRQISTNPSVFTGPRPHCSGSCCASPAWWHRRAATSSSAMRTSQAKKISRVPFVRHGRQIGRRISANLRGLATETGSAGRSWRTRRLDPAPGPQNPARRRRRQRQRRSNILVSTFIGQLKAIGPDAKIRFLGTDSSRALHVPKYHAQAALCDYSSIRR